MKRLTIIIMATTLIAFFNHANAQNPNAKQTSNRQKGKAMTNEKTMLPYKARFTRFTMGDPRYSVMVLNAWKAWDDNRMNDLADMLTDTVMVHFADGTTLKGKEAFLAGAKAYRSGFSSVKSDVVAYTALNNVDWGGRPVVFIWGDETATKPDGTTQKVSLHEGFGFNKDGKVELAIQYARALAPQAATANRKAEEEALRKTDAAWSATATEKKAKDYFDYVTDDVIVMPSNDPMFRGKDAFGKWMNNYFNSPGTVLKWQANKAEVAASGDLGYTYGTYTVTENNAVTIRGKYTMVWKKQMDGTWKVVVDMFSSDLPAK